MSERRKPLLTYANVAATLALVVAVGGASAFAATQLAKNSVGSKQLKKNAVTTAKIKNEAVTAAKVKKGTLTGTQINLSTLGTVPAAQTAQTAQTANALAAPGPWHEVGAPGEPGFQNSWENYASPPPLAFQSVAFYKDQTGFVHLRGVAKNGSGVVFQLPAGYRPPSGKVVAYSNLGEGILLVVGSGFGPGDGAVLPFGGTPTVVGLDGLTFRAES